MPKRIWLVSELYYPEETSTGYFITRIAEGLAGHYDVHVLCGQPTYSARGVRAPRHEIHNGVSIRRCVGTTLDKNLIIFRLVNIFTLGLSILFNACLRIRSGDRVLVVTNPPSMPFIIAFACLLRGAEYVPLIHDNYPEILIAAGKAKPDSFLVKAMNWCNRRLFRRASKIIVVGRDMKVLVGRKLNARSPETIVIPNWAELDRVDPVPREHNQLLAETGLQDKFVLLYAGNMGYPNDLESVVAAASMLADRPEYHFLFIGSGVKRTWLMDKVKAENLRNVTVLAPRPREDQINFLNACDVAIISFVDGMLGVSMPSRTYNTLAAGKPIIGVVDEASELAMVVNEENVGWVVPPHDAAQLVRAIEEARSSSDRLREMGQRARDAAETKYNVTKALADYFAVFEDDDVKPRR